MDASDYGYWTRKSHVPAFGSWDCDDDFPIPFTQCFESATQAGLLRYGYAEDRDLYVARDLYDNRIGTPAMIVVPRRKGKAGPYRIGEKGLEAGNDAWVVCGCDCEPGLKQCSAAASPPLPRRAPKAVDEDLYKISPDLLYVKPKHERRVWGFLASCLQPSCVC